MSTFEKISPDDPRLTAFALGEMEPAERAEFEKLLAHDADARAAVAAISGTAHHIGVALASEEVPPTSDGQLGHAAIFPGRHLGKSDGGPLREGEVPNVRRGLAKLIQFPQMYFTISGLAAACFAIGFIVWETGQMPPNQVHYTQVDLTKMVPASELTAKSAAETMPAQMAEADSEPEAGLVATALGSEGAVISLEKGGRDNAFLEVKSDPVSTFPIKTATAAYAEVRRAIEGGRSPAPDAVRIEELVNFFPYHYAPPETLSDGRRSSGGAVAETNPPVLPFAAHLEVASAPWAPTHRLVRIGLKGRDATLALPVPDADTAMIIAKDVKLEVQFNPAQVQAYRLIGYENRMLQKEDFANDKIDAGEIGAGHTVTALYEVVPAGVEWKPESSADGLKYQPTRGTVPAEADDGLAGRKIAGNEDVLLLKLSYTAPDGEAGKMLEFPLRDTGRMFEQASADFKFAASVAAFGMILRDSPHRGQATLAKVADWAQAGVVDDAGGKRAGFVGLVGLTERLARN